MFVGLFIGLGDALILQFNLAGSRGVVAYLPRSTWFSVPLTWTALCLVAALIFSIPPLQSLWISALTFAGPGLLLLSRAGTAIYRQRVLSPMAIGTVWLAITGLGAIIASRLVRFDYTTGRARSMRIITHSCLGILIVGAGVTSGSSAPAQTGAYSESQHPNIVLIFLDTVRYDDVAAWMPNLDAFAARSITFDNAWAPAPWTLPSHLAVLTGLDPWRLDFDDSTYSFEFSTPTLSERLSAVGYTTGAVFANPVLSPGTGLTRGFSNVHGSDSSAISRSGIGFLLSRSHFSGGPRIPWFAFMSADEVTASARSFITKAHRPYFLALNFMDAHYPYYIPPRCRGKDFVSHTATDGALFIRGVDGGFRSPAVGARMRREYQMAMSCLDRSLGDLLEELQHRHDSQDTVVAIVSDHGEQFGEHGFTVHGNSVYRQVLHVPLVLEIPGERATHVAEAVSITDLYPTLLELAGVRRPPAATYTILDAQRRRPVISACLAAGQVTQFSIVNSNIHLIERHHGDLALYDYRSDPAESFPKTKAEMTPAVRALQEALVGEWQKSSKRGIEFHSLGYVQ